MVFIDEDHATRTEIASQKKKKALLACKISIRDQGQDSRANLLQRSDLTRPLHFRGAPINTQKSERRKRSALYCLLLFESAKALPFVEREAFYYVRHSLPIEGIFRKR